MTYKGPGGHRFSAFGRPSAIHALGRGGLNRDSHSINESWDPKDAYLGPQKNLPTALALVGIESVSQPILAKRTPHR